jgi:hypothetical protein
MEITPHYLHKAKIVKLFVVTLNYAESASIRSRFCCKMKLDQENEN